LDKKKMAHNNKDYKSTVGESGCSYSSLNRTYGVGVSSQVASMANYTVPEYLPNNQNGPSYPPRYDTLSHGNDYLCGGYFSMKSAYPHASCESCNVNYVSRPCDGNLPQKESYGRR
jgi:hypothetical protein